MRSIYAIVVTYNGIRWVKKCLGSLEQSEHPVQTIVVDNHSTDGTTEVIRDEYPDICLVANDENVGFGRANNVGIRKALEGNADYIFLLNQDAWIRKETIGTLVDIAERHPEYGIISPVHLDGTGNNLDYAFSKFLDPERCPGFYSDLFVGNLKEVYTARFVNAASWLISADSLRKVGLFDPIFHLYSEDYNLVDRMNYHGFKVGVTPETTIQHDRGHRGGKQQVKKLFNYEYNLFLRNLLDPNRPFSTRVADEIKKHIKYIFQGLFSWNLHTTFVSVKVLIHGLPKCWKLYRISEEYKR